MASKNSSDKEILDSLKSLDLKIKLEKENLHPCPTEKDASLKNSRNEVPALTLLTIFEYLNCQDKETIKLVGGQLDEFRRKPIFSNIYKCQNIYGSRNLSAKAEVLKIINKKKGILNLEFDYFPAFEKKDSSFWTKCGKRIKGLNFNDSWLNADTLFHVIQHCPNLENLTLSFKYCEPFNLDLKECFTETVEKLLDKNITNAHLHTLKIFLYYDRSDLSNYILEGFFTIFPNLKKIALWYDYVYRSKENLDPKSALTEDFIFKKLSSLQGKLHSLDVSLTYTHLGGVSLHPIIEKAGFKNLREISFDLNGSNEAKAAAMKFFDSDLQFLESVRLRGCNGHGVHPYFNEMCERLLNNCPRLKNLHVKNDQLLLSTSCLLKIIGHSNLTCLHFETIKLDIDREFPDLARKKKLINRHLNSLIFEIDLKNNTSLQRQLLIFIEVYRSLKQLQITSVDDFMLPIIWKYQVNLTSLILKNLINPIDYGFVGYSAVIDSENSQNSDERVTDYYSIRGLKKLEYLQIESSDKIWQITERTLADFYFPKLRLFKIDVKLPHELHDAFLNAVTQMTSLETVEFQSIDTSFTKCSAICSNLNQLQHLTIYYLEESSEVDEFTDLMYRSLFDSCPTLRSFSHGRDNNTYKMYFYNALDKRIMKIN